MRQVCITIPALGPRLPARLTAMSRPTESRYCLECVCEAIRWSAQPVAGEYPAGDDRADIRVRMADRPDLVAVLAAARELWEF